MPLPLYLINSLKQNVVENQGIMDGSFGQFAANAVHGVARITMLPSLSGA
jgi:hypothetical protein